MLLGAEFNGHKLWSLLGWALRDLCRHPLPVLLTSLAVATLIGLTGTILLLFDIQQSSLRAIIENGPSLVVRRMQYGDWTAISPATRDAVLSITGVTGAKLRVWGLAEGPRGMVTLVGASPGEMMNWIGRTVGDGEVAIGPGVGDPTTLRVDLDSVHKQTLNVVYRLPLVGAIGATNIAVTTASTASRILGIPVGHGRDLGVEVFHENEAVALIPDIRQALSFPVHITTRQYLIAKGNILWGKRAALFLVLFIPSLLGLFLLILGTVQERLSNQKEIGLLKALGWTTADVLIFHLARALLQGLPGAVIGVIAAVGFTASPDILGTLDLFGGGEISTPSILVRSPSEGSLMLVFLCAGVLVPWVTAAVLPAIVNSVEDPADLLRGS